MKQAIATDITADERTCSSEQAHGVLTLIVKTTRSCNLRCTYCGDRKEEQRPSIDIGDVAKLFARLRGVKNVKKLSFVWHGGEPLLLGISFFRKVKYLQEQMLGEFELIENSIQTNGTLLNEEWVAHLMHYGFHVGVSIDGPRHLHDNARPLTKGGGSFDTAMRGIRLLQEHGTNFGVLTVISNAHLDTGPQDILAFFQSEGVDNVALLSMRGSRNPDWENILYNRRFGMFMAEAVRVWLERDDPNKTIRELDSKLDMFFGLSNGVCKDGGPCVGKYFGVDTQGTIYHCDKFFDDERFAFGNVAGTAMCDVLESEKLTQMQELELQLRMACSECKWFPLCKGGCLYDLIVLQESGGQLGTPDCVNYEMYSMLSSFLTAQLPPLLGSSEFAL